MNKCIVHIQGGEVSGSIDESARHAITKFSHYHFPSTQRAATYVQRMGEPSETILGPRDTVIYDVRVTDSEGNPVTAELSLSLVDLALLSLTSPNSPRILDFFYSERWLSVRTALLLTLEMDSFNQELQEEIKGGGGGGGGFGVMTIRENFKDTAHWTAQITTDAVGRE